MTSDARARKRAAARGETYDPTRHSGTRSGRPQQREAKAIAAVGCPYCGVAVGVPCTPRSPADQLVAESGRVWCHGDRRTAWKMARDGEI